MFAKTRAAKLSIYSNSTLILLKLIAGLITGSVSVLSEAIHSGVDLIASFIAFFSVRVSDTPADIDHPYGHGKIEYVSGAAEGSLILLAGVFIVYEAIHKILHPVSPEKMGWAIGIMLCSSVMNFFVSRRLLKVGESASSEALIADAHHLHADVLTSLGVLIGLTLMIVFRQPLLDPIAALAVSALIFKLGWTTTLRSIRQLLDVSLPANEVEIIKRLADAHPQIFGFHQIRSRRVGGQRQIDIHIHVPGSLTVSEGHAIAHQLRDKVEAEMGDAHILIHVEPWEDNQAKLDSRAKMSEHDYKTR